MGFIGHNYKLCGKFDKGKIYVFEISSSWLNVRRRRYGRTFVQLSFEGVQLNGGKWKVKSWPIKGLVAASLLGYLGCSFRHNWVNWKTKQIALKVKQKKCKKSKVRSSMVVLIFIVVCVVCKTCISCVLVRCWCNNKNKRKERDRAREREAKMEKKMS